MTINNTEIVSKEHLLSIDMYDNVYASADVPGLLTCMLQPEKFNVEVRKAASDYNWKGDLKNEGTLRLDMWEAAHIGQEYTLGVVQQYKRLVDDTVRREIAFRDSGEVYRAALLAPNCISKNVIESEIARIDQNVEISLRDQGIGIKNYQVVEFVYLLQEQRRRSEALLKETAKLEEQQANEREELLRKQAIERQMWEQNIRIAMGAGLGVVGLSILAILAYHLGKMKGKES